MKGKSIIGVVLGSFLLMGCTETGVVSRDNENLSGARSQWSILDDDSLSRMFMEAIRAADYPDDPLAVDRADSKHLEENLKLQQMAIELVKRGQSLWQKMLRDSKPPDALDDTTALLALYGLPKNQPKDGANAAIYENILSQILSRGAPWERLAKPWPWRGLSGINDARLWELWLYAEQRTERFSQHREAILTEMIRRASPVLVRRLEQWIALRTDSHLSISIETATALRRIQGKPDPVVIEVTSLLNGSIESANLPDLEVALVNRDSDQLEVTIQAGGDYRSGRQARWRIEATDRDGKKVRSPEYVSRWGAIGGGISQIGPLRFGERWVTRLRCASYLPDLTPGQYKLRILYHDSAPIADMPDDISELIVCRSAEIPLKIVSKRVG